jgi:hypothetical protein
LCYQTITGTKRNGRKVHEEEEHEETKRFYGSEWTRKIRKEQRRTAFTTAKLKSYKYSVGKKIFFLVISDPYFHFCKIMSQFAGSRLHLCSCSFTVTYCLRVEKQVIRQFKYYWLIDWILFLRVHVVMKGQSFADFRIFTQAVHATVLFSPLYFLVCSWAVLNLKDLCSLLPQILRKY